MIPRRPFLWAALALGLTALGFAARYAEDNHLGSSEIVSWTVFVLAGLAGYYFLLGFIVRVVHDVRSRAKGS